MAGVFLLILKTGGVGNDIAFFYKHGGGIIGCINKDESIFFAEQQKCGGKRIGFCGIFANDGNLRQGIFHGIARMRI